MDLEKIHQDRIGVLPRPLGSLHPVLLSGDARRLVCSAAPFPFPGLHLTRYDLRHNKPGMVPRATDDLLYLLSADKQNYKEIPMVGHTGIFDHDRAPIYEPWGLGVL